MAPRALFHIIVWAAALSSRAAALLRHTTRGVDESAGQGPPACQGPVRQVLKNEDDVSFTGSFSVGSQLLEVIPDTGSFELVVFSDRCAGCGNHHQLYHESQSATYRNGSLTARQTYGSGVTTSLEAYDNVSMQCLAVKRQMFWQVMSASMPILESSAFQGIFGLGPPASNRKMAEEEYNRVASDVNAMKKTGIDVSPYLQTVQNLKDVHEFAKTESLWLHNLAMRSFSICLRPGSRQPGVFVYNDDSVERHPEQFQSVRAEEGLYWAAKMTHVHIGDLAVDCANITCLAIMDTGTSLIAAPTSVVRQVEDLIDKHSKDSNHCEDLSVFPRLEFTLDGQEFSLPPRAYVGIIEGEAPEWALDLIPSLRRSVDLRRVSAGESGLYSYCSMLLMDMDVQEDGTAEWIFGLPFFRRYYTTFRLDEESFQAQSMHFAEAGHSCDIEEPSDTVSSLRVPQTMDWGPLTIPAHKLRPPRRWAERHRAKYDFDFL